MYVTVMPVSA